MATFLQKFKKLVSIDIVPRLFEEKWKGIVFGFPWCVVRNAWCVYRICSRFIVLATPLTALGGSFLSHFNGLGTLKAVLIKGTNNRKIDNARRPVPRLWIRSAEERGERRYENGNTTTKSITPCTGIELSSSCWSPI